MLTGKRQHLMSGYTFIGLLIVIMLVGFSLAEAGNIWSQAKQRDREQELLKIGDKFRQAIRDYYNASPGPVKNYPQSLEALLRDDRFPTPRRYIRELYQDPITQNLGWGINGAPTGGIMGVFSLSNKKPFKTKNFPSIYKDFEKKTSYSEWIFVYTAESEKLTTNPQ
ncbi:MAG: type II secretion system protein [Methylophilaceae bacterium]